MADLAPDDLPGFVEGMLALEERLLQGGEFQQALARIRAEGQVRRDLLDFYQDTCRTLQEVMADPRAVIDFHHQQVASVQAFLARKALIVAIQPWKDRPGFNSDWAEEYIDWRVSRASAQIDRETT